MNRGQLLASETVEGEDAVTVRERAQREASNVWVVEGGSGPATGQFAAFELRVEPAGWTLIDAEEPTVERLWSWDTIGGLEVVRGAGKTPDGRPATALNVIVNGWPVRVLVPAADLPNETVAMLGAFAPIGHPLRSSVHVTRQSAAQRFSEAGRRFVDRAAPAPAPSSC